MDPPPPYNTDSSLDRGISLITQAISADQHKNYAEAYKLYSQGLDYLMLSLKHEKNPESQRLLRTKINEYLTRAETLKQHIQGEPTRSPQSSQTSAKTSDNCTDAFQRGGRLAEKALQKDKAHDYESAIKLYEDSIDFLSLSLQIKKNPETKRLLEQEITEYTNRIETLKGYLKDKPNSERSNRHLSRALDMIEEAITEDNNRNYPKALQLYLNALECFMLSVKYMENGQTKAKVLDKVEEYSTRADKLRSYLDGSSS